MNAPRFLVVVATASLVCCGDPATKPGDEQCVVLVAVATQGVPAVFNFPSDCFVAGFQVTDKVNRDNVKWRVATPNRQRSLGAPITYGKVPVGLNEEVPPAGLVSGVEYRADLLVWTGPAPGVATAITSRYFTQP